MAAERDKDASSNSNPLQIDAQRALKRRQSHYGVLDIGSNSIRLVVYDDLSRSPFPRFNEKSMVALGAGLGKDGRFSDKTIQRALLAIQRLSAIAEAVQVERIDVLATEATRRATNGHELIDAIKKKTGLVTRILTGLEEANYSAHGILSSFYQPNGAMGDIGGGSLEVAEMTGNSVGEKMVSMPLGALPVTEKLNEGYSAAKNWVDDILSDNLPSSLGGPTFYAVGGGWRALARVHIAMNNYPISVVHGYELPACEVRALASKIAKLSPDDIANLPDVPRRRIPTLAASALVMSRVLRQLSPETVAFSAYGLREGWLYKQLHKKELKRDPLIEGAQAIGLPMSRVPAFSQALGHWTDHLFPKETPSERRLRLAICALTDIAWREHEKLRASSSFQRLLQFPFIGLSHPERVFVAVAILARYGGKVDDTVRKTADGLLNANDLQKAEILGRTLLLAHRFSASVPSLLEHARVKIDSNTVRLEILNAQGIPDSSAVQTRLKQLAKAAGLSQTAIVEVDS